jgi:GNAT superfamily N-acetyltransferase
MSEFRIRTMTAADRDAVAELIYVSTNFWYQTHARPPIFTGPPEVTAVFFDVYESLDPGCGLVAEDAATRRLAGSCFYHPRETHVSLGIMNVHPNVAGQGVARAMLTRIIEIAEAAGKPVRLVSSAFNLDSYSLYTRAGFVPRRAYQDMLIDVPAEGFARRPAGYDRLRDARKEEAGALADLECAVAHIRREKDYHYFLDNVDGYWHVAVAEDAAGELAGTLVSFRSPHASTLGPGVARDEATAAALIARQLDRHRGRTVLLLVPVECAALVRQLYGWGARNCELHFAQIRGAFVAFGGVVMPTFLPESA